MPTKTVTAPCRAELVIDPDGEKCGEPSMATVIAMCVHEHAESTRTCWACAVDIQQLGAPWECLECRDGAEPHECDAVVVIDWDSGEKTIVQEGGR